LNTYGVDMRSLTETFEKEQTEFFMNTSAWVDTHPSQVLGTTCMLKEYDLATVTLEEMKNLDTTFELKILDNVGPNGASKVGAFCGWFDVSFRGSPVRISHLPPFASLIDCPYMTDISFSPIRRTRRKRRLSSPRRPMRTARRTGDNKRSTSTPR
jgi:hypothetical protein